MNGENLMDKDPFKEYIKQTEPGKRDKGYAWHTAIGLQAVDGLKPSKYLIDTAIKNIEGDISIDVYKRQLLPRWRLYGTFTSGLSPTCRNGQRLRNFPKSILSIRQP